MTSKGLDKKGLTAYGTLFGGKKSTPLKSAPAPASAPAPSYQQQSAPVDDPPEESKPLMETLASTFTSNETVQQAMAAANMSGATDYMTKQLGSLKDLTSKGPMTFRVMALLGGCAMVAQCFLGSISKLFSFSPLGALIEVYCGIFGVMVSPAAVPPFLVSIGGKLGGRSSFAVSVAIVCCFLFFFI